MTDELIRRKFQKTDFGQNNNKFYDYVYDPAAHTILRTWGRVGDSGQSMLDRYASDYDLTRLCDARIKKGYHEIKLATVEDDKQSSSQPVSHDPDLRQVLEWIFSEANEYIQSYLAATIDAISLDQLDKGKALLTSIAKAISYGSDKMELLAAIQDYYNTIPTKIPRRIDADVLVQGFVVDEQVDRLEQLKAAVQTHTQQTVSPTVLDQYSLLGAKLERIWPADPFYSQVLDRIEQKLTAYRSGLRELYLVTIPGERARYEAESFGKDNEMLLFHGTRGANVRHILKSGLILNKARSGGLYGPGLYHSPVADKSWNYTSSNKAPKMMFLDLVAVGQPYVSPSRYFDEPPAGYQSVKDHGDREIIVYRESQVTIKALAVLK